MPQWTMIFPSERHSTKQVPKSIGSFVYVINCAALLWDPLRTPGKPSKSRLISKPSGCLKWILGLGHALARHLRRLKSFSSKEGSSRADFPASLLQICLVSRLSELSQGNSVYSLSLLHPRPFSITLCYLSLITIQGLDLPPHRHAALKHMP